MNPYGINTPTPVDLAALAAYTRGVDRAVAANRKGAAHIDYAAANAKTEARRRWVARKKEKEA